MPALRRDNVQGLVYTSYLTPCSRHLLFEIFDPDGARSFLRNLVPRVTRASVVLSEKPEPLLNVGITYKGLHQLIEELGEDNPNFDSAFKNLPNAEIMGDVGSSAPKNWWNGNFATSQVHIVVIIHCWGLDSLDRATSMIREEANGSSLRELLPGRNMETLTGESNKGNPRELHFGYCDGFSQPAVNWEDDASRTELIDQRHFLLGYSQGSVTSLPQKAPWLDLVIDGSYGIMRWIYQDVAAFEKFLTEAAPKVAPAGTPLEQARELVAAKMMGRWRDGTPLVLFPDGPDPEQKAAYKPFSYKNDQDGLRCPLAAHIRIANHRDDPLTPPNAIMFKDHEPHILRRGHSYGPKFHGEDDDGIDRGVIGLFLCTDINSQFYSLMRWMRTTNFRKAWPPEALNQQDPIVGLRGVPNADPSFVIPRMENGVRADVTLKNLPDFVRTQGTLFMLIPGIEGLERISGIRAWAPR